MNVSELCTNMHHLRAHVHIPSMCMYVHMLTYGHCVCAGCVCTCVITMYMHM